MDLRYGGVYCYRSRNIHACPSNLFVNRGLLPLEKVTLLDLELSGGKSTEANR